MPSEPKHRFLAAKVLKFVLYLGIMVCWCTIFINFSVMESAKGCFYLLLSLHGFFLQEYPLFLNDLSSVTDCGLLRENYEELRTCATTT